MIMENQSEWVGISIPDRLQSLRSISPKRCIYRVPEYLHQVNEEAYRPSVVSIGPYYSQDPRLQGMQEQKLRHLQHFLQRSSRNTSYKFEDYMSFVREREQIAREYYDQEIVSLITSHDFINMLLLDATFIIVLFLYFTDEPSDAPFQRMEVLHQAKRNLLLEENQLPFFILEGLYNLGFPNGTGSNHLSFVDLTCSFIFRCFSREGDIAIAREKMRKVSNIKHLVDFLRIYNLPSTLREGEGLLASQKEFQIPRSVLLASKREIQIPKTASELSAAGVKFVVAKGASSLLDIRFYRDKGILEIPKLRVDDRTESFLRSLMLLEQCHCPYYYDSYIVDYVFFLDNLINTRKDVQVLVENGILENFGGSEEETAEIFNNINNKISMYIPHFYYKDLCRDLNEYAAIPWNRWKAILKRNYFSHPWSTISVVFAGVIFILTLLQVITGFLSLNT